MNEGGKIDREKRQKQTLCRGKGERNKSKKQTEQMEKQRESDGKCIDNQTQ